MIRFAPTLLCLLTPLAAAQDPNLSNLPLRGYDADAAYAPDAAYDAVAKYEPDAAYDAHAKYDASDHFQPTAAFRGSALLVVRETGATSLSGATIEERGWFSAPPDRRTDRDQVLAELDAWSSGEELADSIQAMEATIRDVEETPIAAATRDHLRQVQQRVELLRDAVELAVEGKNRESTVAQRRVAERRAITLRSEVRSTQLSLRDASSSTAPITLAISLIDRKIDRALERLHEAIAS